MPLLPGTKLGPYEILAPVGAGGMGEVYRARDARLQRDVAIKVIPATLSADADRLRRFEQEARAAGALNHPGILAIYDLGSHEGAPFIVSELLEGETLRTRIGGAPLPPRKAIDFGLQIARGLAAAHEKGIVHRDLKPENVFVTKDGRVKLLDFGLAKLTRDDGDDPARSHAPTIVAETGAGIVLGTVGYMSPEQVRGKPADHRSDIFSFGTILYEMLSGQRPFRGETSAETMTAILREDPPELTESHRDLPPAVERIVRHCLEKSPEERFQSARDVAFYLESLSGLSGAGSGAAAAQTGSSGQISTIGSAARKVAAVPLPVVIGLIVLAGAASLIAGRQLGSARRSVDSGDAHAPSAARFTQLTDQSGVEMSPTFSPDGQLIAYTALIGAKTDIFLQRIGGQNPINLTKDSAEDDLTPAFSPDGQRIAFRSERDGGGLFVMGATGESVRRLSDFGFEPAWSPDGREIVCASADYPSPLARPGRSQLWGIDVASGKRQLLFGEDAVQPSWSPHGDRIAYWGLPMGGGQRDIWTVAVRESATAADAVPVTNDAALDWNPVWSPDGKSLYFSSDRGGTMNLWRVAIDEASGKTLGSPEPVTVPSAWCGLMAISRDGRSLAYTTVDFRTEVLKMGFDPSSGTVTGQPNSIVSGSRVVTFIDVSPGGDWLAMSSLGSHEDICTVRSDGTGFRRLTDDIFKDRRPRWSPDGTRLLFYSDRGGSYDIWQINSDGSGLTQMTKMPEGVDSYSYPIWCPNRPIFVFTNDAGSYSADLTGSLDERGVELLHGVGGALNTFQVEDWSPDGEWIAGNLGAENPKDGIEVYSIQTGTIAPLVPNAANPSWLADSRRLLALRDETLILVDSRTKSTQPVFSVDPSQAIMDHSFSRDNRTLFVISGTNESDIWMLRMSGAADESGAPQ